MDFTTAATLATTLWDDGLMAHSRSSYGSPFMSDYHVELTVPEPAGHSFANADFLGLYLGCDDARNLLAEMEDRAGESVYEWSDAELEALWEAEQERMALRAELMADARTPAA